MAKKSKVENLQEACIEEAMKIIEASGIENLSMREVARRLGVSHQAPYKHFDSRDHILAEILKRSFDDFARYLGQDPETDDPRADLARMGHAYLKYAAENPLQYRLMFGTPLPDPDQHPEMMDKAKVAYSMLHDAVAKIPISADIDLNALYVWSTIHGLASILQMAMFNDLSASHHQLEDTIQHVVKRIGTGLVGNEPEAQ